MPTETSAIAIDRQRRTIFKPIGAMSLQETEIEAQAAREYLIANGDIEDREYKDDEVVRQGCPHCRKTYGGLIRDELAFRDSSLYEAEMMNLDRKLLGTLYAFVDIGRWDGRHRAYRRLTKRVMDEKTKNIYPADNLNSVLDFFNCGHCDVWWEDGEIRSKTAHHDSCHLIWFREFFGVDLPKGDPRREEYGCSIEPVDFEEMLCNASTDDEWLAIIEQYTKPIGHYAAEIYGW